MVVVELIEIQTPDGTAEAYLARPESAPKGGVLVYMDAIGLRPRLAEMIEQVASWGYLVLAPNTFYRDGSVAELAPTADLRDPAARDAYFADRAMARVRGLTVARLEVDIPAYVQALRTHVTGPLATHGYCMGARLAVRTAGLFPEEFVAVGGFHGGGLVTAAADSPHTCIAGTTAEYYFGHADHDRSMTPEHVADLGRALEDAGVAHTNLIYPDAPHGYTMADTSSYQEAGTQRHFADLEALYARTMV
ncbi:dienelactone hydrolase family protein [Nocardioides sp. CCNWLW239]|uniref:dienelactone hydrolase family protein n=1 Tax=Nocardioides sp. CCNWLW239 TaxID=3128902 RepID=UPI0030185D6D